MLIVCPSCASSYSLTAEQLGPEGRTVRCAQCRNTWFAATTGALPEEAEWSETVIEPEAAPVQPPRPKRVRKRTRWGRLPALPAVTAAPLAALAFVALVLWQRAPIVRALPQTAPLFSAIGMPVNLRGFALTQITSRLVTEEGQPVLVVSGDITAVGKGNSDVPPLSFTLRAVDGRVMYGWTAPAPRPKLDSGESVPFRTRLASPPAEGHDVVVRFAEAEPSVARTASGATQSE
jgi:predicted Zn finger-like uncharacterized protein